MKLFTIAEYQKDPSKLSSRLQPDVELHAKHQIVFGDLLAVRWLGSTIETYTERQAERNFVLRTQYRELRIRPWRFQCGTEIFTSTPPTMSSAWRWVGPEQTILVED